MQIYIHFRKIKESEDIRNYAEEKITREFKKFLSNVKSIEITFSKDGLRYLCKCHLVGDALSSSTVHAEGSETHEAVDNMIKKLHSVLRKTKDKKTHRRLHKDKSYDSTNFIDLYVEDEDIKSEKTSKKTKA